MLCDFSSNGKQFNLVSWQRYFPKITNIFSLNFSNQLNKQICLKTVIFCFDEIKEELICSILGLNVYLKNELY